MIKWLPIELAPKDGRKLLLARYGYSNDSSLYDARRRYHLWWATMGHWSAKWKNWNDGIEPCGLNGPTHFMELPNDPEQPES